MSGATGGVNDRDAEQSLSRIVGLCLSMVQHGIERTIEKLLDKCIWRVVTAGGFASMPFRLAAFGETQCVSIVS